MATVASPPERKIVLENVSWETYERLLADRGGRAGPRFTYDQGTLEIMSPSFEHGTAEQVLGDIVKLALEEMNRDFVCAGNATFKRETLQRGFEPDSSFYIRDAGRMRRKKELDLEMDPPPELIIEVDVTTDSIVKLPLYAAFGIGEVWRYNNEVEIWILDSGRYIQRQTSIAIPNLSSQLISEWLQSSRKMTSPDWRREVRKRIAELA